MMKDAIKDEVYSSRRLDNIDKIKLWSVKVEPV